MNVENRIFRIYEHLRLIGADPLMVGGCVRDYLNGFEPKDIDTEVHGIEADALIAVLSEYGKVNAVGVSFGVIKLTIPGENGGEYDFSLPRLDSKVGAGHRGFIAKFVPMTPKQAAQRRDYTINSVAARVTIDTHPCPVCNGGGFSGYGTGYGDVCDECGGQRATEAPSLVFEIIDPFNGREDLTNRVLRHTSEAFAEDPLRVLRGMQFAGRFNMQVARETAALAYKLRPEYETLAKERIWGEWYKWASKSTKPSQGLAFLYATKWAYLYPELSDLIGVPQEPEWHPEGTVWSHTGHVCDAAMYIARREKLDEERRVALLFGALCHDMGKATTTVINEKGRIASPGHAEAGVERAISFMRSIGAPERFVMEAAALTQYHMRHVGGVSGRAARRLARELDLSRATTPYMIGLVMEADASGRPWTGETIMPEEGREFVSLMTVAEEAVKPMIQGRDLLPFMRPGPNMGRVIKMVEAGQVEGTITNHEEAMAAAWEMIRANDWFTIDSPEASEARAQRRIERGVKDVPTLEPVIAEEPTPEPEPVSRRVEHMREGTAILRDAIRKLQH